MLLIDSVLCSSFLTFPLSLRSLSLSLSLPPSLPLSPASARLVYALLAGFQNFGQNVSRSIGVYLITDFGIKTEMPCNFENLSTLVLIANMALPLLSIPLTFLLIPDALMTDTLLTEGEGGGSDGKAHDAPFVVNIARSDSGETQSVSLFAGTRNEFSSVYTRSPTAGLSRSAIY